MSSYVTAVLINNEQKTQKEVNFVIWCIILK